MNLQADVMVGLEQMFTHPYIQSLQGKKVGLITNHTAVTKELKHSINCFKEMAPVHHFELAALFSPEHGIDGSGHAVKEIKDQIDPDGIPIYSLFGKTKRPTEEMLKNIDIMVYDIQDIGSRSYTYNTTLFYVMEACAKQKIPLVVLDRPNPINGLVVDGPMLKEHLRSDVGYVNVPYCHGMTVGELANFFNKENKVGCTLHIVPMKGWKREMTFQDTQCPWIPTSPYIPFPTTAYYYPMTGILGEIRLVSTGVGYSLPFQLVGAPWIDAHKFANTLNEQNCPGVQFYPYHWSPFTGRFEKTSCHGVMIMITNHKVFKPVTTSYVIMGILKSLYPKQFQEGLDSSQDKKNIFCKVNGTEEVFDLLSTEKYATWKLRQVDREAREAFLPLRAKYLNPHYSM